MMAKIRGATHDEPFDYRQEPLFIVTLSSDGGKQLGSFAPISCGLCNGEV